jgi:hypothetical protein
MCDAEKPDDFGTLQGLYRDWLLARASCVDPGSDEEMAACARKRDAAEMALLAMPDPNPEEGQLTNNRVTMEIGAVKADILRFGLKHPG